MAGTERQAGEAVTTDTVLSLEIPPRAEFVAVARLVVSTAAKSRRDLPEDKVADLTLALSEACTNAIEAHDAKDEADRVLVRVDEDEDRLVVTVEDRGPGFDPLELPTHPAVTDPDRLNFERGLGIPIIRNLVDEVTFTSNDGGTTVTMVVNCPPSMGELAAEDLIDLDALDLEAAWDDEFTDGESTDGEFTDGELSDGAPG
jgi:anti-sigma regulatory factor (Ser/Thr protein kinase)